MNLIKIDWSDVREPNDECRYNHVSGYHPLGTFSIEWKGWKGSDNYTCYFNDDYLNDEYSLDEAKDLCQIHIDELIVKCIVG